VTGVLRGPRRAALAVIAVVLAAASVVALAESYRGLYDWARGHGLPGLWAACRVYREGHRDGRAAGRAEGEAIGYSKGHAAGYSEGHTAAAEAAKG
jgi:hypothetical protein